MQLVLFWNKLFIKEQLIVKKKQRYPITEQKIEQMSSSLQNNYLLKARNDFDECFEYGNEIGKYVIDFDYGIG